MVGISSTAAGDWHAFITDPDGGGMTDLNSLVDLPAGIILTSAADINNAGLVIVHASTIPPSLSPILRFDAHRPDPGRVHGPAKEPAGIEILEI